MRNYIIRRVIEMAILLLVISALVFFMLHLAPGGPFDTLRFSNPRITEGDILRLEAMLGLDKPPIERYFIWLSNMFQGEWGSSWTVSPGASVIGLIQSRLGNTLLLMGVSTIMSLLLALVVGIYSATRQYSWVDHVVTNLAFFGQSMPTFWFGIMMLIVFSVTLRWFPPGEASSIGLEGDILDRLWHLVLPVTVLSLFNIAAWSRFIRSSMLEILRQDYLRTARAKGLNERTVILKHALRNALIPVITLIGLSIPNVFDGAIITETIFAWPGMGRLLIDAIRATDYQLVQAIVFLSAFLVVGSNVLADILYAVADPRIRYG